MLLLGSRASHMIMLVCTLALLMETVRGGSSFLSPPQRPPQGHGDRGHHRIVSRDAAQSDTLQEDAHFLVSPVFRLGVSLTEAEFEEHGSALQNILNTILGDTTD